MVTVITLVCYVKLMFYVIDGYCINILVLLFVHFSNHQYNNTYKTGKYLRDYRFHLILTYNPKRNLTLQSSPHGKIQEATC